MLPEARVAFVDLSGQGRTLREVSPARGEAVLGGLRRGAHCLRALERLAYEKGATDAAEFAERKETWRRAYLNTPHGKPIELSAADCDRAES